jgi:hypothetical protein
MTKDYYKIMDVPYDASQNEIRTAYHQLAKKYHPDKNPDDTNAASSFLEIQEAYFILSDDERRQQFHIHSKYPFTVRPRPVADTPEIIVNKAKRLNRLLKEIDVFRMDTSIFTQAIHLLLSEQNIKVLKLTEVNIYRTTIIGEILQVCRFIPYSEALKVLDKLLVVAGSDDALQKLVHRFTGQKKVRNFWEKYNLLIIVFATLIICLLILFLSN